MPHANSTTSRPALHLAHRIGGDLAVLEREQLRELAGVLVDELAEREQDLRALRERRVAPALRRLPRRLDRFVDERRRRERDARGDLAGRGVEHVARALGGATVELAVDPVTDRLRHGRRANTARRRHARNSR